MHRLVLIHLPQVSDRTHSCCKHPMLVHFHNNLVAKHCNYSSRMMYHSNYMPLNSCLWVDSPMLIVVVWNCKANIKNVLSLALSLCNLILKINIFNFFIY